MLKGESSIGKTWNAKNVTDYFPKEDLWLLGGLSPTALVHDYGILEHAETGEPLDEDWVWTQIETWDDDNPPSGFDSKAAHKQARSRELRRIKKEWRDTPKKYVVDLRHKILLFLDAPHIETFNRLRPILSHDAWEITYKFTDRGADKGLATQTVTIRGWPATIFCTSDKSWMEDLSTRSFTATPLADKEKIRDANRLTAKMKSRPWMFYDDGSAPYKQYLLDLKAELADGWEPVVPFADELAHITPPLLGRDMRDFKHILTLIEIMALFHFYTRPKVYADGGKYVLATMQDFLNVFEIWQDIEMSTQTGLSGEELFAFECLSRLEEHDYKYIMLDDVVREYNKEQAKTISSKTAYKYMENLCQVGLVDKQRDSRSKEEGGDSRRNVYRTLGRLKNRISTAWENNLPFFTVKGLEKWFVDVLKYSPQNTIRIIEFLHGEDRTTNHTVRLGEDGQIIEKNILENLFSGEYYLAAGKPEKQAKLDEKPQKKSPAADIQFIEVLEEGKAAVMDQLAFSEMGDAELCERLGLTLEELDQVTSRLRIDKLIERTFDATWRRMI